MKIKPNAALLKEAEVANRHSLRNQTNSQVNEKKVAGQSEDTIRVGLAKAINQLSNPRSERIAELKALIESGEYKVDSRRVANAVVNTLNEEIDLEKLLAV